MPSRMRDGSEAETKRRRVPPAVRGAALISRMSLDQPRTPAGRPTGGEFAPHERAESDLDLAAAAANTLSPAALARAANISMLAERSTEFFAHSGVDHSDEEDEAAVIAIDGELWFRNPGGSWSNTNSTALLEGGNPDAYDRLLLDPDAAFDARMNRAPRAGINIVDGHSHTAGITVDQLLAEADGSPFPKPTASFVSVENMGDRLEVETTFDLVDMTDFAINYLNGLGGDPDRDREYDIESDEDDAIALLAGNEAKIAAFWASKGIEPQGFDWDADSLVIRSALPLGSTWRDVRNHIMGNEAFTYVRDGLRDPKHPMGAELASAISGDPVEKWVAALAR